MANAVNGSSCQSILELCFRPVEQFNERRAIQFMSDVEIRLSGWLAELVERANQLAVIAAINTITHGFAELNGNRAFQFYRQVGNAASGIYLKRRNDRFGRAGLYAGCTSTAM